jgi:hypothetical protein
MPNYSAALSGRAAVENSDSLVLILADGVVPITRKRITCYAIAKAICLLTLPAPTPADEGKILIFWSELLATAHVLTGPINAAGVTATWAGAAGVQGEMLILVADNLRWWTVSKIGVVVA